MSQAEKCIPTCEFFRCGKNALTFRGGKPWCKWVGDECDIENCNFATCVKRRLLPGGICGMKVKRRTVEIKPEEFRLEVKVRGKVLRKLPREELI